MRLDKYPILSADTLGGHWLACYETGPLTV